MESDCLLSVGFGDFVERGTWENSQDVVKGCGGVGLVGSNFIANSEDLTICKLLAIEEKGVSWPPAALRPECGSRGLLLA
jgi:hypothetical protein